MGKLESAGFWEKTEMDSIDWVKKGKYLSKKNRYQDALDAYNKAIQNEPTNEKAWIGKHNTLCKLEQYDDALDTINKAIKINPNDDVLWDLKGHTLICLKKYRQAAKSYNRAAEIDPNNITYLTNAAQFLRIGQSQKALEKINQAIEIDPNRAQTHFLKSDILLDLGLNEEAYEAFDRAVELDPELKEWRLDLLERLEPIFEPIFTKLNTSKNLQYIEKFCQKFPNCIKEMPEFLKLQQLLVKNGCLLSDVKLKIIIEIAYKRQEAKIFKAKLLHNNPKTSDDLIRNFLDMVGEADREHIGILFNILQEDFNYRIKDLQLVMERINEEGI